MLIRSLSSAKTPDFHILSQLAIAFLLFLSPPFSSALAADPVIRASIIELSIHGDGSTGMKVLWRTSRPDAKEETAVVYEAKKFSFEWMIPPKDATGFIAAPLDYAVPSEQGSIKWIDFVPYADDSENISENSYYLPFILDSAQRPPLIDREYLKTAGEKALPMPRISPSRPMADTGWCFIGIWQSSTSEWSALEWDFDADAGSLTKRSKPYDRLPSALIGTRLVADFNWKMRKGPAVEYEEVEQGHTVRAGTIATVLDIAVDSRTPEYRVWGKFLLSPEKLFKKP